MDTNPAKPAIQRVLANRQLTRASQMLSGIVAGILADGQLHDSEILMLRTWLGEHHDIAAVWPGSAVAQRIDAALHDGVIGEDERAYLMQTLQQLCNNDFAETGSVSAEVGALPFDMDSEIIVRDRGLCFTGEFVYGTRAACTRLAEKAGALVYTSVSRKVHCLVVGTHVSPNWINESYGTKIMQAMRLREGGHDVSIVPERLWLAALQA